MSLPDNAGTDRYRTRTTTRAAPFERTDPAVWGPMESDGLAAFESEGFLVFEELLDPGAVVDLRAEIGRLADDPAWDDDGRSTIGSGSDEAHSVFGIHRLSPLVTEVARESRILELVGHILGSVAYLHQSRADFFPGFHGSGCYWHSDFEMWHAEDSMPTPRAVSLVIALSDHTPHNGSPMLMPGSHRTFVPCPPGSPAKHSRESLREQQIGVPAAADIAELAHKHGITQFTGRAGAALLFDSNLMYGSSNNITPFPRSSLVLVFNSEENRPVDSDSADSVFGPAR
ncbi:phytanoyl-CoA dioxygenase family protein [Nocardia sp. NPDC051756]|uniref:phytanoyl-CoA dioxygenase family protein n=1 Tax=Nocardia sp. NPDC051756 TaxID=3154751 RepID=UPI0034338261